MTTYDLSRRAFHRFGFAALGGLITGAALADQPDDDDRPADSDSGNAKKSNAEGEEEKDGPFLEPDQRHKHVCRGLNVCKGHGRDGRNQCAGRGICATVPFIECATTNDCKHQGGCGAAPGENECKGRGGGQVPLIDEAWERARERFEQRMARARRKFGSPPKTGWDFTKEEEEEYQDFVKEAQKKVKEYYEKKKEEERKKKEEEERKKKEEEEQQDED